MTALHVPPFFARLRSARRVLVAGAGGGFDIYAGLPLALSLMDQGKDVHLANLSFSHLHGLDPGVWVAEDVAALTPRTVGHDPYAPELTLARWLDGQGLPSTVHAFPLTGVRPLRAAYRALIEHLGGVDAVVLVDGGTDILLRGDESGLGTPEEDMASLAAVSGLEVPVRLVASIGFGVDAHHGVRHAHVLENMAALEADGAALGCFSVPRTSREGELFLDAVAHAQAATPARPSIVNGSIAAAMRGEFGDVHFTERTRDSELFINPLMSVYFAFELDGLVRRSLYLDQIEDTYLMRQISSRIEEFRERLPRQRPPRSIPH
ncbi:DUF1152 domain-containing protein [Streptomyces piniterrae]|uniref:DUF1152 domain-containing protein n=1 Tax=Streptomyces piniterrae TaxID=2571125 RepID=A0A4U0MMC5_9ACTN|nr:DUF1152 domain-containing protein [Streptomyces piniterrae]TJZ41602.1 DUF1152 domain-containing protein [Streptomyces piniterrae]